MDMDETLLLILERIDSPVTLIRAASTCRRWRRLIADAGFLRRCRSLHRPLVAGNYNRNCARDAIGSPWFVPSSSIDARHFSLDFVVDVSIFESRSSSWGIKPSWQVRDSRGSLLLMECIPEPFMSGPFPDLIVCEPLTRRYRIIPRPPHFKGADFLSQGIYLVDGDEDEAGGRIGLSNFRVLCLFVDRDFVVAYTTVFTAGGGGDTNSAWSEKAVEHIAFRLVNPNVRSFYLGRALGSSYSYVQQDGMLITRDGSTGKFSSFVLSLDIERFWNMTQNSYTVDGGDGEPRIVTVTKNHTLEVLARVDGQWRLENKVLLSKVTCGLPGYRPSFFDKPLIITKRGVGFVVISSSEPYQQWPFSVDIKTMEVAPAAKGIIGERMVYPCEFPWPPILQVCLDR